MVPVIVWDAMLYEADAWVIAYKGFKDGLVPM